MLAEAIADWDPHYFLCGRAENPSPDLLLGYHPEDVDRNLTWGGKESSFATDAILGRRHWTLGWLSRL